MKKTARRDEFLVEPRQQLPGDVILKILQAYVQPRGALRGDRQFLIDFWGAEIAAKSTAGVWRQLRYFAAGTRKMTARSQRIFMRFVSGERLRLQQNALNELRADGADGKLVPVYDPSTKKIVYRTILFPSVDAFDFYDMYAAVAGGVETLTGGEEARSAQFMQRYGAPLVLIANDSGASGAMEIVDWSDADRDALILQYTFAAPKAPPWPADIETVPQTTARIRSLATALQTNEKVRAAQDLLAALDLTPEQLAQLKKLL